MTETLPPGVIHFNSAALPPSAVPLAPALRSAPHHTQVRIVTPPPQHHAMAQQSSRSSPRSAEHRESTLSQSEAREKLSDWIVYRFEKVKNPDDVDENGYPVKPSWDHVHRYQVNSLSRKEISKQVRDLDRKTLPAAAKKSGLSEPIQYQLNKAHDYLMQSEYDPRYHYILAQLDCELKQRDPSEDSEDRHSHRRDERRSSSSRRKSKSRSRKSKSKTRKTFERVSVTAYFKRTPRREEDAVALYQMYQRRSISPPLERQTTTRSRRASISDPTMLQRASQHYPHPSLADHHHHHHHHHQRRHSQILPAAASVPHQPESSSYPVQVISRDGREVQVVRQSPKTSNSSLTDEDDITDDYDNELTPQSSVDGSPARQHSRHARFRSRSPSRERPRPSPPSRSTSPAPYGAESPRQHSRQDENYVWASTPGKLPHAPSPPHASKPRTVEVSQADDLEKFYKPSRVDVRRVNESWERGRRLEDDRRERHRPEPEIEVLEQSSKPKQHSSPPLSQPSRINRRRASVRIVAPEDIKHGSYDSDRDVERHFERLRIDEERHTRRNDKARFQDERGERGRRNRRSVDYTSRHPDEIFHMEDHISWDERAPRDHRRRASSSDMDRNPFAGRPISHRASEYR